MLPIQKLYNNPNAWLVSTASVIALLGCHWLLATTAIAGKSATFDEPAHLGSGVCYWRLNDYRLNVQNGLPQRLASLPVLALTDGAPRFRANWTLYGSEFEYGKSVLQRAGGRAPIVLQAARMTMALLGVATATLVWLWSTRMNGQWGGLVSLLACCFEPSILANAPLVATDIPVTLTMFAATLAIWMALERVSLVRVGLSCLSVAAVVLTKWTGVLIVPITGLLLLWKLLRREPIVIGHGLAIRSRVVQGSIVAGLGVLHVVAVWAAMWASVGFRFSPTSAGAPGEAAVHQQWNELIFEQEYRFRSAIDWLRRHKVVPETFLASFAGISKGASERRAFFFGEVQKTGFTWFFPWCMWAKTNPALFVLLAIAAVTVMQRGSRQCGEATLAVPLCVLLIVYCGTTVSSQLNIGQRHLLPVYPALFVLAGAAGGVLAGSARSWVERTLRYMALLAVVSYPVAAVMVWPNYLAYFNNVSGGSATAYRRVVDSSLDWGQELVSLKRWLLRNNLLDGNTPVYLSAFSSLPPQHYGLHLRYLRSFFRGSEVLDMPSLLEPGVYCISATMLSGVYSGTPEELTPAMDEKRRQLERVVRRLHAAAEGSELRSSIVAERSAEQWQDTFNVLTELRFIRLCALLRDREPDEMLGYAMLIYRLSASDLAQME